MNYTLRLDISKVSGLASHYVLQNTDQVAEDHIEHTVAPAVKANGLYNRDEFLKVCHWKTPRSQPRCAANDEDFIHQVTRIALSTQNERLRIEVLTLLNGVDFPTASVLLHFGHSDRYPILDFRALESLGIEKPKQYTFGFWWDYVAICRNLADKAKVSMRTLDRALWQYSSDRGNDPT